MIKTYNIMIVDDDPLVGGMICRYLDEKNGFEACYFENPLQALKKVVKISPDLIILDWAMPKLSGLQFLLRLRKDKQTKELPVFMLTAKRTTIEDLEAACSAGVAEYLSKPINFECLNNHIMRYFSDD